METTYGSQAGLVIQQETAPMSPDSYPSLFCQKDQNVGSDTRSELQQRGWLVLVVEQGAVRGTHKIQTFTSPTLLICAHNQHKVICL